jgi:hypothetical protein
LVDQATGTARETAAFARRVVLRTLTVVGGAAAGTALAWCLSTAGASADTAPLAPEVPVVDTIATPASGTLTTFADRLRKPPPDHALDELGERVKTATDGFGARGRIHDGVEHLPGCADPLCGLDEVGRADSPAGDDTGLGRSDTPPAPAVAPPAHAGKVATPGADPDRTAERTATDRAYSDGMSRRGSPAPGAPSLPGFPAWPAPLAPVAPPAPGNHGSTGNPADSALLAALPWQPPAPALVRGLTAPGTEVVTFGRVGAQPGVTPD